MTRDEVTVLMGILKTAYPKFYSNMTKEEAQQTIDLWASMFADDNAKIVAEAVRATITTFKYPPTIADVKEKIMAITNPNAMTELEAWNTVKKAINYYRAAENFNALPPILQELVGTPDRLRSWALMEESEVETIIQSNFMRSYKVKAEKKREYDMFPETTKKLISNLSNKLSIGGTDENGQEAKLPKRL